MKYEVVSGILLFKKMEESSCQLCGTNAGKYSCPKCNIFYCSVGCYRSEKHLQCSEAFYENWVKEELKNYESDPIAKNKMLEILKQNQESGSETDGSLDSDDDESEPDLASRMAGINLDDDESIWEKLTTEEKREFRKLVATGNIIKIIPEWEPWWKTKKRKTLIQDCEMEEFDWKSLFPPVTSEIPELSKLTKSEPSPFIPFMLLNILASYAFTVRWFKETHKDMSVEATSTCIALSATLRSNEVFKSPAEAFIAFANDLSKCEWVKEDDYDETIIIGDVKDIISEVDSNDLYYSTKAALSDLNSLIIKAKNILKESKSENLKRFSGPPPKISLLRLISKKMTYYLSWTVDHGSQLINSFHSSPEEFCKFAGNKL